ncbi:MAG: type II toxin-antitoxin system RelE/ParE family toxin [Actinomycetota bacterium]|nr:type II toxin-antitoxin system RelE/ParE family toxin [Actinomycetota bacterium]
MARVVVTHAAGRDLRALIRTHRLPDNTVERVKRSIRPLADFPELGAELGGPFAPRRFLLGPWRWMIVIYRFDPDSDLVAILAIVDGRTSTSPTAHR